MVMSDTAMSDDNVTSDGEEDITSDEDRNYNGHMSMMEFVTDQIHRMIMNKVDPSQRNEVGKLFQGLYQVGGMLQSIRRERFSHVSDETYLEWDRWGKKEGIAFLKEWADEAQIQLPAELTIDRTMNDIESRDSLGSERSHDERRELFPPEENQSPLSNQSDDQSETGLTQGPRDNSTPSKRRRRNGNDDNSNINRSHTQKKQRASTHSGSSTSPASEDRTNPLGSGDMNVAGSKQAITSREANEVQAFIAEEQLIYEQLSNRFDANNGSLIVGRTHLLKVAQLKLVAFFGSSQPTLSEMRSIAKDLIGIISSLSKFQKHGVVSLEAKIKQLQQQLEDMEAGTGIGDTSNTFGTILCILEKFEKDDDENNEENDDVGPSSELTTLREAIYHLQHGDGSEGEASESEAMEFIRVGDASRRLLRHILHFCIMLHVISKLTPGQIFSKLRNCREFTDRAKKLCHLVGSSFDIDNGSILDYFVQVVRPAFDSEHRELASQAAIDIKNTLTNTKGQHLRLLLCSTYGEGESVTSGGIVESGQDYCSGEDKVGPRRRITTSFCAAFFHDAIEGRLPPNLFTKRGYLRALFNASPSEIDNSCNAFFTKKFYQGDRHGTNSKVVKGLETGMLKKKRSDDDFDSGSRTVVIESQETIQCMVRLTEGL